MTNFLNKSQGLTITEILIVLTVLVILAVILTGVFSRYLEKETLNSEVENIISVLEVARSKTLASKGASKYGVRFEPTEFILFRGSVYSAVDPENKTFNLHTRLRISSVNFTGGGPDIIFNRLTGSTDQDGTITVSTVSGNLGPKVITIEKTGTVDAD